MGKNRLPHFGKYESQIREFIRVGQPGKREMYLTALKEIDRLQGIIDALKGGMIDA